MQIYYFLMPSIDMKGFNGHYFFVMAITECKFMGIKTSQNEN